MFDKAFTETIKKQAFTLVMATAAIIIVAKAYTIGQGLEQRFAGMGNDDILRLTMVRDLIAGQSWFDQTQYKMAPPDGLPVHWSRYIDGGIAALVLPLSLFLPMQTAEQIAVMIWPTLILLITACVIGFGTRRIFGTAASCFAVACLVFWPLTADLHARPGNIDHHNVQYLMMVIVLFAIVWPDRPNRAGLTGGIAAAFSLAVGLENLAFLVLAGAVLLIKAAYDRENELTRLRWFCVGLFGAGVVFWLGQASDVYRFQMICDQLGIPILALVGLASFASLVPFAVSDPQKRLWVIVGMTAALTAVGFVMLWPVISVCITGPYGTLPPFIQEFIAGSITEALPGLVYAQLHPTLALLFNLPLVAAIVLAFTLLSDRSSKVAITSAIRSTVLIYSVFCVAGFGLVFYQMRTVNLAATPVPMLAGFIMAHFLQTYLKERSLAAGAKNFLSAVLLVAPTVAVSAVAPLLPESKARNPGLASCRSYDVMQSMNEVPPAVILAHGNLGTLIIWSTHHSALAAPYHRSATAMSNAILPFRASDEDVEAAVRATGAEMLMLCKGHTVGSDFMNSLSDGVSADWLRPVPVSSEAILLFEILPE